MLRKVRPGFEWRIPTGAECVLERVSRRLLSANCPVSGLVAQGRIELHVHGAEEHLWSPQLIVDVHNAPDGSLLRARFGPHPSVWTMYMAGYAVSSLVGMMSAVFALAQLVLGETPWSLWGVPLSGLLAAGLYLAALFGQGLSHEQMDKLEQFLAQALEGDVLVSPAVA